jgi:hypothetical protein
LSIAGEIKMSDKKDAKEKIRKIYEVLPKLNDQRCGYKTCGEFAKAVAEGKAPCYGCVSGGPQVAAKVCEIMGVKTPEEATTQASPGRGYYEPGLFAGRGMGGWMGRSFRLGMGRGLGGGRGMGQGRGMGRGGGMGRGFGRGRHGR